MEYEPEAQARRNGSPDSKVLESAGATVVNERPQHADFIDLSPENLTKSSIISLFQSAKAEGGDLN